MEQTAKSSSIESNLYYLLVYILCAYYFFELLFCYDLLTF